MVGLNHQNFRCCFALAGLFTAAPLFAQSPSAVAINVNADQVIHTMQGGMGASWHAIEAEIPSNLPQPHPIFKGPAHGGSAWGGNPPAEDNGRWKQIERHADWLGLDFVRVEIEQRMWEPERDRFTWDTPEMRILYRILDWCESRHADVFLQNMWGNVDWNAYPEYRGDAVTRVHSAPYDIQAFADGLAALMKHLTQTKHYTCIRWLCINNEPGADWSWWQKPRNEPLPIRPGLAAVRAAFDREGIKVPLSGPDWTDMPDLKKDKIDFDEFVGAYDLHCYYAKFDWAATKGYSLTETGKRLANWRKWATDHGKPLFISEFGTMVYGWRTNNAGPACFEAALKNAELIVRGLNCGVDGFNRWSFINRGDLDGQWQLISTWNETNKTLLKNITPYPNDYFVYGLITRLTAKHSSVLACETRGGQVDGTNRVFATALRSPQNQLTWIIVNDAPQACPATLDACGATGKALHKYQVTFEQRNQPYLHIEPLRKVKLAKGATRFTDTLPAMSLTIYSTYDLKNSERGITE